MDVQTFVDMSKDHPVTLGVEAITFIRGALPSFNEDRVAKGLKPLQLVFAPARGTATPIAGHPTNIEYTHKDSGWEFEEC